MLTHSIQNTENFGEHIMISFNIDKILIIYLHIWFIFQKICYSYGVDWLKPLEYEETKDILSVVITTVLRLSL